MGGYYCIDVFYYIYQPIGGGSVDYEAVCYFCGNDFVAKQKRTMFCGKRCRDQARYKTTKVKIKVGTGRICRYCGDEIMGANYFYCGPCHYNLSKGAGSIAEGHGV